MGCAAVRVPEDLVKCLNDHAKELLVPSRRPGEDIIIPENQHDQQIHVPEIDLELLVIVNALLEEAPEKRLELLDLFDHLKGVLLLVARFRDEDRDD